MALFSSADNAEIGWFVLGGEEECRYLPKVGYLDRSSAPNGMPTIKYMLHLAGGEEKEKSLEEPIDDPFVILSFINALSCSNVRTARHEPKKSKPKSALPFDAYHVLTIGTTGVSRIAPGIGAHRSPREHLRRGHIRRLDDGRRIWVNATVVAAGRGAGVVTKDYAFRAAQGCALP